MEPVVTTYTHHRRLSIRGVVAGVLVAFAVQLCSVALAYALGNFGIDPGRRTLGPIDGMIAWRLISACLSLFLGGMVASLSAGALLRSDGLLHGLVTWAAIACLGAGFAISLISAGVATVSEVPPWAPLVGLMVALASSLLGGWAGARGEARTRIRYAPPVVRPTVPTT